MMRDSSLHDLLHKVATENPNRAAYRFMHYEGDPKGFAETVTWSQVLRRSLNIADELRMVASSGDRVAIAAPQSLDYIIAFWGVLQAGLIAVPLPAPQFGIHDERISSALRDCQPTVILTNSAAMGEVEKYAPHACAGSRRPAPEVIAVDSLDLDAMRELRPSRYPRPGTAYLQYTSGSTGEPSGVVVTHKNVIVNCGQMMADLFDDPESVSGTTVGWLPFYHDMGLMQGILMPMLNRETAVLMSPLSFLQRPSRWIQLLAKHRGTVSAAPNFGFELAARRTSDADMAGLDLGGVQLIVSGAERVNAGTLKRFTDRFARFNFRETVIRPSYGLAEAMLYVATERPGHPPKSVRFDYDQLSAGQAKRCADQQGDGAELISYGASWATTVRIVDPETSTESPEGEIGEIWVHGDNVAVGYWQKPQKSERTFNARLVNPSPGTPEGPWLRTGDLGVISERELFIVGRLKDLLIIDGRNHYPDDIETTIQEITNGRVAAISVQDDHVEKLVVIVEFREWGNKREERLDMLRTVKHEITSAIIKAHGVRATDLVLVAPGSIPITTSGKIRRSACVDHYKNDKFTRLDIPA